MAKTSYMDMKNKNNINYVNPTTLKNTGGVKYTGTPVYTASKTSTTSTSKPSSNTSSYLTRLEDYNLDSLYKQFGGGSGSGYNVAKADISGLLAAYDAAAESNRQALKTSYDTSRSDLLTSLKRFQEANARDVANQRLAYNTGQAALESAREQANRQTRISNAARGLGGSGLQQLAQMQNLLSQSSDISNLANENQEITDALRLALAQQQEDYDTNLSKAERTYYDALAGINSGLAQQKASAIYENEQNYINALNNARAQSAAANSQARQMANAVYNSLKANQDTLRADLSDLYSMSDDELEATYGKGVTRSAAAKLLERQAYDNVATLATEQGLDQGTYNTAVNNLASIMKNMGADNTFGTPSIYASVMNVNNNTKKGLKDLLLG